MYVKDALAGRDSSACMHSKNSLRALKVRRGALGVFGAGRTWPRVRERGRGCYWLLGLGDMKTTD